MSLGQSNASGKHSTSRSPTPLSRAAASPYSAPLPTNRTSPGRKSRPPFGLLARFEGDKVAYVQFLEDSYGTAGSFKTGGATRFPRSASGKQFGAQRGAS